MLKSFVKSNYMTYFIFVEILFFFKMKTFSKGKVYDFFVLLAVNEAYITKVGVLKIQQFTHVLKIRRNKQFLNVLPICKKKKKIHLLNA